MRVTSFGSGSNGNAFLVQSGATALLIDAGVPIRLLRAGLKQAGVSDGQLSAVLLSHEHIDHVRSVPQLLKYHPVPFAATGGTIEALRTANASWTRISAATALIVGDMAVTPISVSHDAAEPVGFVLQAGDVRAAIFTDLGESNGDVRSALGEATIIVLESNYDERLLRSGPYPAHLKRRIRGPLGHLGNDACGELLACQIRSHTTEIWLAHLSETNNRPDLARASTEAWIKVCGAAPNVRTVPRLGASIVWDSNETQRRATQASLF
jgi:phosphoribosyl 1,2-cyclic phosphodiesterase